MSNETSHDLEPDISIDLSDLEGFPAVPATRGGNQSAPEQADAAAIMSPEWNEHNLDTLRRAVRQFWVVGNLCSSLHNELLIRVGVQEERRVMYPSLWTMTYQQEGQDEREFDDIDALLRAFDQSGHELLILGADGAGKTTVLLQIAEALSEPNNDELQPIPVVFNLATWGDKFPRLSSWLIHELVESYLMPQEAAQSWVFNDELIVLLDGLDEVVGEHQAACARAINDFRQNHAVQIVVCCERDLYEGLDALLNLTGTIHLHPYTTDQIVEYIDDAESNLSGFSQLLADEPVLANLAQTPLWLTILSIIFSEQRELLSNVARRPERTVREHILDLYVVQMLHSRQRELFWSESGSVMPQMEPMDRSLKWLQWLARRMALSNQSIFQVDHLQRRKFTRSINGVFGLPLTLLISALYLVILWFLFQLFGYAPLAGMIFGAIFGYILRTESILKDAPSLLNNIDFILDRPWGRIARFFPVIFFFALIFGGSFIGSSLIGIGILVAIWFLFGNTDAARAQIHQRPNQRTWLSLYSGLSTSAAIMFIAGLTMGFIFWSWHGNIGGVFQGIVIGLIMGLAGGLLNGLYNCIAHLAARSTLFLSNSVPWAYTRFLDYAASRLLLRKIGGGYIFAHPILRDHLANLNKEDIAWITKNFVVNASPQGG